VTDNIRESLSALIDGEASEIELHRLLREINQHGDLKESWAAYQQIRSVMGNHAIHTAQQHLELSRQISAAIEAETDFEVDTSPLLKNSRYVKPLGGLAVAASITLAAFIGFYQPGTEQNVPAGLPSVASSIDKADLPKIDVQTGVHAAKPVQLAADSQVIDPAMESYLKELPPEKLKSLRTLLSQYDRQMAPQTRTVIHKDKKAP
jgi:sigma-E factor negative regulatory protein RseA